MNFWQRYFKRPASRLPDPNSLDGRVVIRLPAVVVDFRRGNVLVMVPDLAQMGTEAKVQYSITTNLQHLDIGQQVRITLPIDDQSGVLLGIAVEQQS